MAKKKKEKICACYIEGKSLCGNRYSRNTIFPFRVTCQKCLHVLKSDEKKAKLKRLAEAI